jgi:hypothetical protein
MGEVDAATGTLAVSLKVDMRVDDNDWSVIRWRWWRNRGVRDRGLLWLGCRRWLESRSTLVRGAAAEMQSLAGLTSCLFRTDPKRIEMSIETVHSG